MKIYTRTGDDGTTSLAGGKRVPKDHIRVNACGSIDELISWIGLLRSCRENNSRKKFLLSIQDQLMEFAVYTANDPSDNNAGITLPDRLSVEKLEKEIDKMDKKLKPLKSFILPGGRKVVSYCHIARCVCRRAEREVSKLNQTEKQPDNTLKFLNRLSDYLFVLSRKICLELDIEEVKWLR